MVNRLFITFLTICLLFIGIKVTPGMSGDILTSSQHSALRTPHSEKRVDVKKGLVAFVEMRSTEPATLYLMYPTQYSKYAATGSVDGVLEFKNITWLIYPVAAMLEDQTLYFVPGGDARFDVTYEDIKERIDRLLKGEERLRGGMEMWIERGVQVIRLTPLIPGLKVRLDLSVAAEFVIVKTIDFARYRKGLKSFDQLYEDAALKGLKRDSISLRQILKTFIS